MDQSSSEKQTSLLTNRGNKNVPASNEGAVNRSEGKKRDVDLVDGSQASRGSAPRQDSSSSSASSSSSSGSETAGKVSSHSFGNMFSRMIAFLVVVIVFSRFDFFTQFGNRSGRNLAHLSPLSIAIYGIHHNDIIEKNKKLLVASKKISIAFGMPGEIIHDAMDDINYWGNIMVEKFGLGESKVFSKGDKLRKKNKKFNIEDNDEPKEKSKERSYNYWKRSEKWVESVVNDRSIKAAIHTNHLLIGISIAFVICSIISLLTIPKNINFLSFFILAVMLMLATQVGSEVCHAGMTCIFLLLIGNLAV